MMVQARAGIDYESSYGKARPNDTILKLQRTTPYYKRNRAHICSFYIRGECTRGAECPYRHEMPETGELSQQNIKDRYYGYVWLKMTYLLLMTFLILVLFCSCSFYSKLVFSMYCYWNWAATQAFFISVMDIIDTLLGTHSVLLGLSYVMTCCIAKIKSLQGSSPRKDML